LHTQSTFEKRRRNKEVRRGIENRIQIKTYFAKTGGKLIVANTRFGWTWQQF
jgi:hypothetical protein